MNNNKTIRLLFPEWQGGNNGLYSFGSKLLEFLAPKNQSQSLFEVVPVKEPPLHQDKVEPENGMVYREDVKEHMNSVRQILDKENPDRIVTFGGDCLVSQVPFSWLNDKYNGQVGILWVDAHPDIKTPNEYPNSHAMVLGNLLGEGDKELSSLVKCKFKSNKVMYAGLIEKGLTPQEQEVINRLKLRIAPPESLSTNSQLVLNWIKEEGITNLAIHLDLDVLNPDLFRNLLFSNPDPSSPNWRELAPYGKMTIDQVTRVINDVSTSTNVISLSICEHLPYDAWNLKEMLSNIPIVNDSNSVNTIKSNQKKDIKTTRVYFPEWQGGHHKLYPLGCKLLEFLAPVSTSQSLLKVPVKDIPSSEKEFKEPKLENGILYRSDIVQQMKTLNEMLNQENPDRIVTFGGDCLVSQVPFSWLNDKYNGQVGILWIDAHPDIKTPNEFMNAHTMVLGNLLGEGDKELSSLVKCKFKSNKVMYAGLIEKGLTPQEQEVINRLKLRIAPPESLSTNSQLILNWIKEEGITNLAIHLDLDVLDPDAFRSILFAEPNPQFNWREIYPVGKMNLNQVTRVINDVSTSTNVISLSICEHLPFDSYSLNQMLSKLPIINK